MCRHQLGSVDEAVYCLHPCSWVCAHMVACWLCCHMPMLPMTIRMHMPMLPMAMAMTMRLHVCQWFLCSMICTMACSMI